MTMTIINCAENLSQDLRCLFFSEEFSFDDLIKQLPPCAQLRYDIEVSFILVKLEDFDDVWMILEKIGNLLLLEENSYQFLQNIDLI